MSDDMIERIGRDPAFQELFAAGHRRRLPKDHIIIAEGEHTETLMFILSGSVAVKLLSWHGREVLLAYMYPGDFLGEMGLLSGDGGGRSATVVTRSECMLLEISYPRFLELARKHAALWIELASQLARRLRATNRRLVEMPLLSAADRVWSVIAELADHVDRANWKDGAIPLRITRRDLGRLSGCSREAAGTALQEFASAGRIRLEGHQILVLPVTAHIGRDAGKN